jgi:hypothetical protein
MPIAAKNRRPHYIRVGDWKRTIVKLDGAQLRNVYTVSQNSVNSSKFIRR